MNFKDDETEALLARARKDDGTAIGELLEYHRGRLRKMIAVRMDPRLAPRIDASDVVQETMAEASRRIHDYLGQEELPFYPWLRGIAMNRLTDLYRHHILAQKRTLRRESPPGMQLSEGSVNRLANRMAGLGSAPSAALRKRENSARLKNALNQLDPPEREILVLTYLEEMSSSEIAVVHGISERSVRRRHRAGIERLGNLLKTPGSE